LKRLEANHRPLPNNLRERKKILFLRIIFDRDIKDHQTWIKRTPEPLK